MCGRQEKVSLPRSFTKISCPSVTSLCWLMSAFRSFKILFFESKSPSLLGSMPPAVLARLSLTSCTVVVSVISMLVGNFLMGFFAARLRVRNIPFRFEGQYKQRLVTLRVKAMIVTILPSGAILWRCMCKFQRWEIYVMGAWA